MKQLNMSGSVENMTKGNVFRDKNGDYVIVSQTSISPQGLKNYEEIKDMNKQVHSSLIVMDVENIMNQDEYETAWNDKMIRQGDVVKYGGSFFVAERNNPGKITTLGWLDGWIKVVEMTDDRFESAKSDKN